MKQKREKTIINVWKKDLQAEFVRIISLHKNYNYISIDTEFPGVISKPIGNFTQTITQIYQQIRCNCNILKIIQLGMTLSNKDCELPTPSTWQFNFKFDIESDMYAEDSLSLLLNANLDFKEHKENGIDLDDFGELFFSSGLLMNPNICWITFHGAFDFGYLLKLISSEMLPETNDQFMHLISIFFRNFYDLKYMISGTYYVKKGLQEIADTLEISGIGPAHQAGSDSYLTMLTFFRLKANEMMNKNENNYSNKLFSLCKPLKQDNFNEQQLFN
ncbi:mrna deadenylase subunit [Tubulinosema ratisbonensis]|uniref:poly(A)-specific ribonuclease n=1 Tax=Tubulinosema ratisbonensis TaxID=291195 RepID=A0A437APA1_9MICR|nr:mrna deadenylase subunit [Tubulinosema ratisbonensis]